MRSTSRYQQGFVQTDDGLSLYWKMSGDRGTPLVCCNGIGVSTHFFKYVARQFESDRRVVQWDYRGHGRSARPGPEHRLDIPRMARDLGCVIDGAGLDRAVLLGHSMGAQVILERYRQAPEQVLGLVSILGTFGHPLDTFGDLPFSSTLFDLVLQFSESAPRLLDRFAKLLVAMPAAYDAAAKLGLIDGSRLSRHDLRDYTHHLADMGFPQFFQILRYLGEHTAADILPTVTVPALVVAAENDGFTPPRLARQMHEALPRSTYLYLEGASHAGIVEQPEAIGAGLEAWLREHGL